MRRDRPSALTGHMTMFLLIFIAASVAVLLIVGQALEIDIKDLWGNRVKLPVATLILGCVSIILVAHFGARLLTRPILELDEWTRDGKQDIPTEISNRQDELGRLARSMQEMRRRLEDEMALVQIDRDVHRALNQMRVITLTDQPNPATVRELLSVIITQANADAAMLVRRDPDGGGFAVIASNIADDQGGAAMVGGTILDDLVPERLLIRYLDTFEVQFGDLDDQAVSWANRHFGGSSEAARTFINLPVESEGRYLGSLWLVRSRAGPSLAQLRPLAGSLVSCAKYIETSIQRDSNWTAIMISLSRAVDAKSTWTNGHSERVAAFATAIGERLMMTDSELASLKVSALLHDVGKIAIPGSIIDKPARLSDEEMGIMRQHPERGAAIVENIPGYKTIRLAILHHHERWDGQGYPQGVAGELIPLHARIISVADVYDAMTSDRPYRRGLPAAEALSLIESQRGTAFDADLVRIFLSVAGH